MSYEHRAQAFFGEHFDEDGMGNRAVDDEHAFDTGLDGAVPALDFGDHAAGNDAVIFQLTSLFEGDFREL